VHVARVDTKTSILRAPGAQNSSIVRTSNTQHAGITRASETRNASTSRATETQHARTSEWSRDEASKSWTSKTIGKQCAADDTTTHNTAFLADESTVATTEWSTSGMADRRKTLRFDGPGYCSCLAVIGWTRRRR